MVTEIMGLLILLGAALLLAVRWHTRKRQQPMEEQQDMQHATEQLRQELERTGNEITARMEGHVTRLERLIQDAERSRDALEGRIAELRELMHMGSQQMDAMRGLRSEIAGARQLQRQLMELRGQAEASLSQEIPAPSRSISAQTDFSQVLRQSIARDDAQPLAAFPALEEEAEIPFPAPSEAPSLPFREEPDEEAGQAEDAAPPAGNTDSARARSLLMSGRTVEEVARETGMGRGAVELMQEMLRRQFAKDFPEE